MIRPGKSLFKRSIMSWRGLVVSVFLVAGIVVFLEIISFNHNFRLDLTPSKTYSLSEQTIKILKALDRDIEFTVFYRAGNRNYYEEFFRRFASYSSHIKFKLFHLDRNPAQAKLYGVSTYGQAVAESVGKKEMIAFPTEEKVLNTIIRFTDTRKKRIYFTSGHGEHDTAKGYSALKEALRLEDWLIETVHLSDAREIPARASVLVVPGPVKDFFEKEIEAVSQYVKRGGSVIFMVEPFSDLPRVKKFLEEFHIELGKDIIVDTEHKLLAGDYLVPLIPYYVEGPITSSLKSPALFPTARSVEIKHGHTDDLTIQYLAKSAPESWTKNNEDDVRKGKISFKKDMDRKGPVPVAVMAGPAVEMSGQGETGWNVVCFGDSDFLNDEFIDVLANKDLFMNTVNWLTGEKDLISIRQKQYEFPFHHMTKDQGRWAFLIPVIITPGIFLLFGVGVLMYRRWRG